MAEAPGWGLWSAAVDSARAVTRARMDSLGIPGWSVAVGVRRGAPSAEGGTGGISGGVVWSEGFGWADVENRLPVAPETRFRIASISKALTAAAVGILVEEGRLDLDAPVQRYVPDFPRKRWPVTTRLLGGHLAGVRHYHGLEFLNRKHYTDVVDALEIFADDTLLFEPGTRYSYSTYGWNLISAVVQGAAEEHFLQFMRRRVLQPAGMKETVAEHTNSLIAHRARYYVRDGEGRLLNAPWVDNSNKWAGGGYLSTARDLVRYGLAYLDDTLMDPSTRDLLWTPQCTRDGTSTGYGIGWSSRVVDGRRQVWHTGGAVGGSTILMIWPEDGVVVAILTNLQSVRHVESARAIASYFSHAAAAAPAGAPR